MFNTFYVLEEKKTHTVTSSYLIKVQKYFLTLIYFKCYLFLWWQNWIFSIITPVFSVTWSFRNHYNM